MNDFSESERLTVARHGRRHKAVRKKLYCATPEGVKITAELLLQPLIDFLRSKDCPPPPDELNERLGRVGGDPYPAVALAILAPILDAIARGWEGHDDDSWRMLLAKHLGEGLRDWLALKETETIDGYESLLKKNPNIGDTLLPPPAWERLEQLRSSGGEGLRRKVDAALKEALALQESHDRMFPETIAQRAQHLQLLKEAAERLSRTGDKLIPRIRRGRKSTYKFLHDDWGSSACVVAGDWMLRVAEALPCFAEDEKGRPCIAPEWQDRVDKICDDLLYRHPVMLPHRSEPRPWAGWWAHHGDRLRTSFVRDWRPETRKAIEATFAASSVDHAIDDSQPVAPAEEAAVERWFGAPAEVAKPEWKPLAEAYGDLKYSLPFAHVDGVDALKRVPLRINQSLLPLVDKFAVELMDHKGDKQRADRKTVKADLRHANWAGNGAIYLDYNCDRRGRVYSIQQLNYAREDHVRALFEFERGESLRADGCEGREAMHWLEIHCANTYGEVDKKPWDDRLRWAKEKTDLIERVAADPQTTFDHWRAADKPFAFVAACQELVRARRDLAGCITHLPIGFDGTCNGIQQLALLALDEKAGALVNLIDSDEPQDIYSVVTTHIMNLLENEDGRLRVKGKEARDAWCFKWWRDRLGELDDTERRKLFKNPIMTFPYSATVDGMGDKIVETYRKYFENNEPRESATTFLARAVRLACQDELLGPVRIMKYIRALALHRYKQGRFLEWRTGTGFPVANAYQKPNVVDLDLGYGGVRSRYTVADGALPEIMKTKVLNAASPNFIHSLDATHLIRTVLAANKDDIRDILPVHDSMACLAPFARRFGQIIRREMAMLYTVGDPLKALRDANVDDPNLLPLPPRGNLDPYEVQNAEYPFM